MTVKYDVDGFVNLREAGGMPCEGGRVRTGRFLRSEFPESINAEGAEFFSDLPLVEVIDLRDDAEVDSTPAVFADAGFKVVRCPIFTGSATSLALSMPTIDAVYRHMVQSAGPMLGAAVVQIAQSTAHGAVLVHCTAGKDRTGVVSALVQSVLGAPDADVVANYMQTQANLAGAWAHRQEAMLGKLFASKASSNPALAHLNVEEFLPLLIGSPAAAIRTALETAREIGGSVEGYLLRNGVSRGDLELLRKNLVEPA